MKIIQLLDVYEPLTLKPLGSFPRSEVHTSGMWHKSVNGFILREKMGVLEILVQQRSMYVDIAQMLLDQSLATQVLQADFANTDNALLRGLKEELGIEEKHILRFEKFNVDGAIRISKRYEYNSDLWNRELITAYGVLLKANVELKLCNRIKEATWMRWEDFCNVLRLNPATFTKTSRIYVINDYITNIVGNFLQHITQGKTWPLLTFEYHYVSESDYDLLCYSTANEYELEIYSTEKSLKKINSVNGLKSIPFNINNTIEDVELKMYINSKTETNRYL